MSNLLAGKVCIITDTGGSMGRAAALRFAREGALIVGCGLRADDSAATVEEVRAAGGTMVSLHPCDLSRAADCQAVFVNTASLTALMSFPNLGSLAHTTAKAGIIGMTCQLAMEGREHGIRANSISPGSVPQWMVRGGAAKDLPGVYIGMRQLINDHRVGRVGAVSAR